MGLESLWSLEMAAPRASGASRWPLPEPREPRDGCSWSLWSVEMGALRASGASRWPLPEPLEPRDSCSPSLWSLEIAAPRAPVASRRLLPEPLEPRDSCSQSPCSLQEAAPRAFGASRWLLLRGNCRGDSRRSFEALLRHPARKHSVISAATNQQVNIYIYIVVLIHGRSFR